MMQSTRGWGAVTAIAVATVTATVGASSASAMPSFIKQEIESAFIIGTATAESASPFVETMNVMLSAGDVLDARLSILEGLDEDHDGEGASAPNHSSISIARRVLSSIRFDAPVFSVGLTSEGNAVAEFEEEGSFGQLIFMPDLTIEAYLSPAKGESVLLEGCLTDESFKRDVERSFGFSL